MPPRTLTSLFGIGRREPENDDVVLWPEPSLKLDADKNVYRPGDLVTITVEIRNPPGESSLLLDKLSFEATGIEKLDTQWFNTNKPLPNNNNNNSSDSSIHNRRRRGEYVFMDASVSSVVSNQLLSSGTTRTYILRMNLPTVIPPSYRGSTVRYLYHVKSVLSGKYLNMNDGRPRHQLPAIEARLPLQIWVTEKTNGLLNEETESNGIVPATPILLDVYWKDMDAESEWARANETFDGVEEDYESQRDDVSSVSSYKPARASLQKVFGSQLSLQSSSKDVPYNDQKSTASSYMALPQVSAAEVLYGSSEDILSARRSSAIASSNQQPSSRSLSMEDDSKSSSVTKTADPVASEGFIRGRKSYNIRLDDQVLLRFSPTKPESTYYFGDMIGGALTFFHEEGSRRCLELSVTLELSETISRRSAHPSRRHSPTITKIQSDHHEVVADLVQTSFLFSVPMDGPMSFSTRHVSVQWVLRFEFFITPKNVDWTRYEHPLLIEGRDKFEWVLPITVHAPPFTTTVSHSRTEKPASIEPLWDRP